MVSRQFQSDNVSNTPISAMLDTQNKAEDRMNRDTTNIARFLRESFPPSDSIEHLVSDTLLRDGPQIYRMSDDTTIALCGTIDENTSDFTLGRRFFDNEGSFYHVTNGMTIHREQDGEQLVNHIKGKAPIDEYGLTDRWIHPTHLLSKAFFAELKPDTKLKLSAKYVNRLGFVVSFSGKLAIGQYGDEQGRYYTEYGALLIGTDGVTGVGTCMQDIAYEIRHFDMFQSQIWAYPGSPFSKVTQPENPEFFNPNATNDSDKIIEFHRVLLRATTLGEQLGYNFQYLLDTRKKEFR